jgi:hypothetical protein
MIPYLLAIAGGYLLGSSLKVKTFADGGVITPNDLIGYGLRADDENSVIYNYDIDGDLIKIYRKSETGIYITPFTKNQIADLYRGKKIGKYQLYKRGVNKFHYKFVDGGGIKDLDYQEFTSEDELVIPETTAFKGKSSSGKAYTKLSKKSGDGDEEKERSPFGNDDIIDIPPIIDPNKFKVGDKVRIKETGKVGIITELNDDGTYKIEIE